jgi:HK97 family phage major capsid protein
VPLSFCDQFYGSEPITSCRPNDKDRKMARKTSADIRAELLEHTTSAQALVDIAKEADRDLDQDEESLFNEYSAKIESSKAELAKVEEFEAKRRQLAELQVMQAQPLAPIGGVSVKSASDRLKAHHRLGPLRAFKGNDGPRDAYDCGMWLRAVVARANRQSDEEAEARVATRGWDVRATATEGSSTAGGYLVPAPMANAIIDVRALAGVSRQLCRVMPMTSETLNVPRKTAGTTVYYPGEAAATTASDQTWGQIALSVKKRAILSKISQELRDDAIISIVDDLVSQMGLDFAIKEDSELIDGDGTSTYGGEVGLLAAIGSAGLYTPANGAGLSVWSGFTLTEFANTMAKLPSRYQARGPVWVCSSEFYWGVMWRLLASAGGNTVMHVEGGPSAAPAFMGKRVYLTDHMPQATATSTVSALYGSFNDAVMIGDRGGVSIKQSEHLNFDQDVLAVLATTRYDINVHDSGDASNAGAYVGLKTAAS